MGRRKNKRLEFRFYELPLGSDVLALLGDPWVGVYGQNDPCSHFHNLFEIGYCHFGSGKLILGEEELPYEDAMLSLIPANYPHSTVSQGVDSWEFLFFDPQELIDELFPDNPQKRAEILVAVTRRAALLRIDEVPELAATVWRILEESREKRPYCQDVIRNLLKICLLEIVRVQTAQLAALPSDDRNDTVLLQITPALHYIDEHYARNLRAADLARECGLSEPHFRRIFEESMNMPPMDYLNLTRVRRACKLMSQKHDPMDIVAAECGFASVSAFTRNFKKFLGVTPYQWKLQRESRGLSLQDYNISVRKGWDSVEP